jgi:hypothetical protein
MEPVIKLQAAQANVSVNAVEGEPDECGAKEARNDNSNDKIRGQHDYNNGKAGSTGNARSNRSAKTMEHGLYYLQCNTRYITSKFVPGLDRCSKHPPRSCSVRHQTRLASATALPITMYVSSRDRGKSLSVSANSCLSNSQCLSLSVANVRRVIAQARGQTRVTPCRVRISRQMSHTICSCSCPLLMPRCSLITYQYPLSHMHKARTHPQYSLCCQPHSISSLNPHGSSHYHCHCHGHSHSHAHCRRHSRAVAPPDPADTSTRALRR